MKNTVLLPFAVALALSGVASEAAHAAQDPAGLIARAEQGDVNAMLQLGQAYLDGRGMAVDVPRAIQLLESVIARNGPQAAFAHTALGAYYERSMRSADDKALMFRHYRLAAGLGDTAAQSKLGGLLLESIQNTSMPESQVQALRGQAVQLLEHAHANGRTDAAFELGSAYLSGRGLPLDREKGVTWLTKAADAKHRMAAFTLGYHLLKAPKGAGYDADRARHYLNLAAQQEHKAAMTILAEAHLSGEHWEANPDEARRLAALASLQQASGADNLLKRAEDAIEAREQARIAEQKRIDAQKQAERLAAQQAAAQEAEAARIAQAEQARAAEAARLAEVEAKAKEAERQRIARIAQEAAAEEKRRQNQLLVAREARPAPAPAATHTQLVTGVVTTAASTTARAAAAPVVRTNTPAPGQYLPTGGNAAEVRIAELSAENTRLTQEVSYLRTELQDRDERIASLSDNLDRAADRMEQIEARLAALDAPGGAPGSRQLAESKPQQWNRAGLDYFRDGQFDRAVREFERAARAGNVEAMNNLGMAYLQGRGVPRDPTAAMAYFRDAAAQGHATAANNIGYIYENGLGVNRDHTRAQLWYRRAAHLDTVAAGPSYAAIENAGYRIVAH